MEEFPEVERRHARADDDEEIRWVRRHPTWWDRWVTPTTLMALFGAIVWGVQLNFAVISMTEKLGALDTQTVINRNMDEEQNRQIVRISVILEQLEKRVTAHSARELTQLEN